MKRTTMTGYTFLNHNNLGGGVGFAVTSLSTYNSKYRAFSRCQTMAQAEGSLRLHP